MHTERREQTSGGVAWVDIQKINGDWRRISLSPLESIDFLHFTKRGWIIHVNGASDTPDKFTGKASKIKVQVWIGPRGEIYTYSRGAPAKTAYFGLEEGESRQFPMIDPQDGIAGTVTVYAGCRYLK